MWNMLSNVPNNVLVMPHGFGRLIAVTGGIGSGKSLICRVLSVLGYDVYDCDSRAKALMDSSTSIKQQIFEKISTNTIIINNNPIIPYSIASIKYSLNG